MKQWMISLPLISFQILVRIEHIVHSITMFNIDTKLYNIGAQYFFTPSYRYGGGSRFLMWGENPYTLITILMMFVVFFCIVATTMISTYYIHRYFLRKNKNNINVVSYLRVTWIELAIFAVTLFLAFTVIFSLWFVLFVWLGTQVLGYLYYSLMNRYQGYPHRNYDIIKAYLMSTFCISLLLMLFL